MEDSVSQAEQLPAEIGVSAAASVVPTLGFPNNRVEQSAQPTGWQASVVTAEGTPDQALAVVTKIGK
jgi:ubiquinone biosynthesis protein COQ9